MFHAYLSKIKSIKNLKYYKVFIIAIKLLMSLKAIKLFHCSSYIKCKLKSVHANSLIIITLLVAGQLFSKYLRSLVYWTPFSPWIHDDSLNSIYSEDLSSSCLHSIRYCWAFATIFWDRRIEPVLPSRSLNV